MGRRARSKADSIKFNAEKQKRFYDRYHPDRSANPLPVSTLTSTSNNLPASSLPANIQGRRLPSEQLPSRSAFRTEQSDSDSTYHGIPTSLTQANDMDTEGDECQESNTTDSEGEHQLQLQAQIQAELQQADNPQIDCVSSLARHLFAFQGYTIEEHTETDNRENPNHSSEDHLTLEGLIDFFDRQHRPPIFDEDDLIQSRQVYEDTHPLPNFQALFTGISVNSLKGSESSSSSNFEIGLTSSRSHSPRVNAETEPNRQRIRPDPRPKVHIQWDFDSFLGFAPSLDFAKQGLLLNTYPRFQQNISRSVHLFSNITDTSNPTRSKVIKVPLHNVPHYYFGKVIGREDISVEKATNFPGSDNGKPSSILRNWFDSILYPAIYRHVSPTSRQHFPFSWEHAILKAETYQREEKSNTSTENARDLTAIWLDILGQLPLPGNELYRDAFIFFANMNTKLNFKDDSPGASWATFNLSMSSAINFDNLDRARIYADLGKETAATDWDPSRGEAGNDSLPTTYLIRTCCQKSFARWADLGEPGKSVKAHFYTSAMLRDVTDMTLDISRYYYKRNQGWIYSQTYNSFKEIYDAAKCKPFGSKFLQQLARDPEIDKMIRAKGKGSAIAREKIWKMYFDCRYRFANACSQAAPYSFGVREEHRLSFTFIDRLEERLRTTGEWDQKRDLVAADYQPFWKLPSATWLVYLQQNCLKYIAAFEWIYTANLGGRIPYEQCKVMIMLLQALPYTFNTGPDKQRDRTALWQTKFQRNRASEKQLLGMGIKDAIDRCGYGWMLDRIDWERLAFRPEIAAEIAYADNAIRDEYRKNWKEVVQSKGDYTRIEATSQYIKSFLLVNLMRIYRQEIFRFISHLVRPESQEQAKSGQIIFCRASFQQHFVDDWEQDISISDMRRTKTKLIQDLLFHMWGFTDEERKHWESLPFRALSKRACEILGEHCGAKARRQFHDMIGRYFIATHWLFPRPTHSKFVQRNHWNEMCWTEVYHRRFVHSAVAQNRIVNVSLLLPTTVNYPTQYRPSYDQTSKEGANDESLIITHREIDKWLTGFMQKNGRPWDPKLDEEPEIDRFGIPTPKRVLRRWRMVDWDFSVPGKREHISQIPSDHVATLAPFDSELETITSALDMAWRAWQQIERPDE
ncbi:hypothetical protein NA56DRAFT_652194, partial [Hyaloscypha hepaticicola]